MFLDSFPLRSLRLGLAVVLGLATAFSGSSAIAASALLESVKQNPQVAKSLCAEFRKLNSQGVRSSSPQAIAMVARRQGISPSDAEIVITYVVGLHCPDVR
ncbi:hypothetical protein [Synechococcus sp. CS-603]|uniref:hypothetical protein n=1 Tax=Synechococcus sp. CS-603 TaxID=2847981 RepID=UPI00223A94C8|nr:hypothetical protein [Synechococcus sp. CS-603]MCT4364559.1 hypothetical protein [Candidatus Regnicoccus frigidus MAG-AL1]